MGIRRKATIAMYGARVAFDPGRLDVVLRLADALRTPRSERAMARRLEASPHGERALAARPRVMPVDLDALRSLPEGTLGRTYADHMRDNDLNPHDFPDLPDRTAGQYAYAHLYEVHDVWHTFTGLGTDLTGELALQAFTLAQVGLQTNLTLITALLARTALREFRLHGERIDAIAHGWAMGRNTPNILGVDWPSRWNQPLDRVRDDLGLSL